MKTTTKRVNRSLLGMTLAIAILLGMAHMLTAYAAEPVRVIRDGIEIYNTGIELDEDGDPSVPNFNPYLNQLFNSSQDMNYTAPGAQKIKWWNQTFGYSYEFVGNILIINSEQEPTTPTPTTPSPTTPTTPTQPAYTANTSIQIITNSKTVAVEAYKDANGVIWITTHIDLYQTFDLNAKQQEKLKFTNTGTHLEVQWWGNWLIQEGYLTNASYNLVNNTLYIHTTPISDNPTNEPENTKPHSVILWLNGKIVDVEAYIKIDPISKKDKVMVRTYERLSKALGLSTEQLKNLAFPVNADIELDLEWWAKWMEEYEFFAKVDYSFNQRNYSVSINTIQLKPGTTSGTGELHIYKNGLRIPKLPFDSQYLSNAEISNYLKAIFYDYKFIQDGNLIGINSDGNKLVKVYVEWLGTYVYHPDQHTILLSKEGRTLIAVRALVETLGLPILWSPDTREVTIFKENSIVVLKMDSLIGKVITNGETHTIILKVAPKIINNRTMLPFRDIANILDCDVEWDGSGKFGLVILRKK